MAVNFLVADDARVAVVFVHRNNPKCVGLWRWDLTDDRFYAGHWMLGKVHLRKTDLSPDGEYLLLLAANYSRKREIQSWTALTRAPFLTAIAFWRWIGTYGGGGLFGGKRLLINTLCERDTVPPDTASGRLPGTRGVNLGSGGGYHRRLSRAG